MNRLRTCAALLSIASMIVAAILLMLPSIGIVTIVLLVVGAACLAIVAPFEAMNPPARKRVVIACIGYVLAAGAALAIVAMADGGIRPMAVLAALIVCGLILTGWAFKTRNRRRRVGWNDYFDA